MDEGTAADRLAVDALDKFVSFLESLSREELEAVASLGDADVDGFAAGTGVAGEAGFELLIGMSAQLVRDDHAADLAQMRSSLDALKASRRGLRSSTRWPP